MKVAESSAIKRSKAQDRLRLRADGRVLVQFKTVWRDGTSHFLFEPIEFLEKLAALIPRPAVNMLFYHGVLAPRARWRSPVVGYGRPAPDRPAVALEPRPRANIPTPAWTWAALMRRVFALEGRRRASQARSAGREIAEPPYSSRWLRPSGTRRREQAKGAEEGAAVHH